MRTFLALLTMTLPSALAAQHRWTLALERGLTTYSSAAHDTASPTTHLRPWKPAIHSLRLAREGRRVGVGVAIGYAHGKLGVDVEDFAVLPGETFDLLEIAPEVSLKIGESSTGAVLRAHAGPLLDIWWPEGEEQRYRLGGQVGASLGLPVTGRWEVVLRGDIAVTPSFLNETEAAPDLPRDATMRRGRLGIGIVRRL